MQTLLSNTKRTHWLWLILRWTLRTKIMCAWGMGHVFKSMDATWPKGRAMYVIEEILKKYRPNDLMMELELNQKLSELMMKADESPTVIFTQLARIENWHPKDIPQEKVLPALMSALQKDSYKMILSGYIMAKSKNNINETLEDVEETLVMMWRSYGGKSDCLLCGMAADEVTLGSFEVECYKCRRRRHKANKCSDVTITNFQGYFNLCGKKGHKKEQCWNDERNAEKRPAGLKNRTISTQSQTTARNDTSNSLMKFLMLAFEVERQPTDSFEFSMFGMGVPNSLIILNDPDILIGDTGATVHSGLRASCSVL